MNFPKSLSVVMENGEGETVSYETLRQERLTTIQCDLERDSLEGKPIAFYLNNKEIDSLVVQFYKGKIYPSDDEKTFQLLEKLTSQGGDLIPLYHYCFCYLCTISDGALSEVLGGYGRKMIMNNAIYCIEKGLSPVHKFVAYDFALSYDWRKQFQDFSDSLNTRYSGKLSSDVLEAYLKHLKEAILAEGEQLDNM